MIAQQVTRTVGGITITGGDLSFHIRARFRKIEPAERPQESYIFRNKGIKREQESDQTQEWDAHNSKYDLSSFRHGLNYFMVYMCLSLFYRSFTPYQWQILQKVFHYYPKVFDYIRRPS